MESVQVEEREISLSGMGRMEERRKWTESRPYAASVPGPHSLSAHTLRGESHSQFQRKNADGMG
jgi:hypothetical protein